MKKFTILAYQKQGVTLSDEMVKAIRKLENREYYQEVAMRSGKIHIDPETDEVTCIQPKEILLGDSSVQDYLSVELNDPTYELIESKEKKLQILNALSRLTKRERTVIVGIFYKDYRQREIAKRLGVSPQNINSIKRKALRKLKGLLGDE